MPNAVVVDGFLTNPRETRTYALSLPFTTRGNYPGARTLGCADSAYVPFIEKHIGEKITWFDTHPFSYNGAFQTCTEADGNSWIHHDCTDWAGILFLTPDAPVEAGLNLYRHTPTGAGFKNDAPAALAETHLLDRWEVTTFVGNVFNRLVLFRGEQFHKSAAYFGSDASDGRLFQTFFFNTASPPIPRWPVTIRPRVAIVMFSTNRFSYLEKTLESMKAHVSFDGCDVVSRKLYDDWPRGRDSERMRSLVGPAGFDVVEHETNKGLGATWKEAWDDLRQLKDFDWVFHLEEDVEFVRDTSIFQLIRAVAECPEPLSQVFLKRQVCYPSGDFIRDIEDGTCGRDVDGPIGVVQDRYFVAMCSVYPREIVDRYASDLDPHEHTVRDLFRPKLASGMYGDRHDPPAILHTGEVSRGLKVSTNDPTYERFAHLPDGDYAFDTGRPVVDDFFTRLQSEAYSGPLPEGARIDLEGWINAGFSECLDAVAARLRGCDAFLEVGSWKGASASRIAGVLKPKKLCCVDTWLGSAEFYTWGRETPERNLNKVSGLPSIFQTFVTNVKLLGIQDVVVPFPMGSIEALKALSYHKIKFAGAYVDAGHEYESVLADLNAAYVIVSDVLWGDDYSPTWPGVVKAVDEFARSIDAEVTVIGHNWMIWLK